MRAHLAALATLTALSPLPGTAEEWKTRPDDIPLSPAQLSQALVGKTVIFHDNGRSDFLENGSYSYTYGEGGTWLGHYTLNPDSIVCVTFVTGTSRCDLFVFANEKLVVITQDGLRFPIRETIEN
ncbi:hypothetical protein [Aliiroseovarius marinus]|uniref:hypothetical protein n=1 Tax=Aliiroseovarius marinus TaxID=2500159 RepID=UPI003D7C7267